MFGEGAVVTECTNPHSFSTANSKAINRGCGLSFLYSPEPKTFKEKGLLFVLALQRAIKVWQKAQRLWSQVDQEAPITVRPLKPLGTLVFTFA